jgi:hypothetical protein
MNGDYDPRADLPVPNRRPAGGVRGGGYVPRDVVEPTVVFEPPPPRRSHGGDPAMRKDLGLVLFVAGALVIGLVTWNLAGAVTSAALTPTPASPVALVTASPGPSASAVASPSPTSSAEPSVAPSPTATPKPVRKAVNLRIEPKPAAVFAPEYTNKWCAAAAVQIVLNINGPDGSIDTTKARQAGIRKLQVQLTTRKDSRNGGAGPLGMVASLNQLGKVDYGLRIFATRSQAVLASAKAIRKTGHPVILLAWRGAHSWVMTGFRADADPVVFKNAKVSGTYIIDPWYPRVSSIWGRSDKPGVFQDAAEMKRNYLAWKRPEGKYPTRDGRFLAIIPLN